MTNSTSMSMTDMENDNDTYPRLSMVDSKRIPQHKPFSLSNYLVTPISPSSKLTSILLLMLALATGINDAATFIDYHLFVSNQTGNTVFMGIGALSHGAIFDLRHVGLSLGGFCAGGLVSGQICRHLNSKRPRWWVVCSNGFQTILTLTAAALRQWYAVADSSGPNHGSPQAYSVIALLAFASGLQVAMARGLGVAEIPTGMITSAWIDLVADENIWYFWRRNTPRDRRLAFVLCILIGGFIGAAAHVYCAPALPLLLAGIVKAVATTGFAFGRGEDQEDEVSKKSGGRILSGTTGKWEVAGF